MRLSVTLLVVSTFLIGCSEIMIIDCPPPVVVLKKIEKAYPVYAVSYDFNLKGSLSTLDSLHAEATGGFKTQIKELRDKLNQESATIENLLKTAYLGYSLRPCDSTQNSPFWQLLTDINERSIRLEELKLDVQRNQSSPTGSPGAAEEILDRFEQKYTFINN